MRQDQQKVKDVDKDENETRRVLKSSVDKDDIVLKQISKRIEDTLVAQKTEETRVPISKTRNVSGIMTREALESAKKLAKLISENRISEWA
jgi:hypothetical protein